MRKLDKALLATASLTIMSSAAVAQVVSPLTPGSFQQYVDVYSIGGAGDDWTNIIDVYSLGTGRAVADGQQFATLTANQFGAADTATVRNVIDLTGFNTITQVVGGSGGALGGLGGLYQSSGNLISVFSANGPTTVTPQGLAANTINPSKQIASTDLNSVNVSIQGVAELSPSGTPLLDLRQVAGDVFGGIILGSGGSITSIQDNYLVAGYDIRNATASGGTPVTTGSSRIGQDKVLDANGVNTTQTLQANIFSANTATVDLKDLPSPASGGAVADVLAYQKLGTTDVSLTNVAAAGSAPVTKPGPGPIVPVDPEVINLLQFASVTANSLTVSTPSSGSIQLLGGDQRYYDTASGGISSGTGFANQSVGVYFEGFSGGGLGELPVPTSISVGNLVTALTWNSTTTPTGANPNWSPTSAGVGDVSVRDVTQAVSISLNSVSGNANVDFGGNRAAYPVEPTDINSEFGSVFGATPFTQVVGYGAVGPAGGLTISSSVGSSAGILGFGADTTAYEGFFEPNFNPADSVNVIVAGTGAGKAEVTGAVQSATLALNTVNLDNSVAAVKNADGSVKTPAVPNSTTISGDIAQVAFFEQIPVAGYTPLQLSNVAVAAAVGPSGGVRVAEGAKIDGLTQVASFDLNSINAGNVGAGGLNAVQYVENGDVVLGNLAVSASVRGAASVKDLVQYSSYTANTANLGTGGGDANLAQVYQGDAIGVGLNTGITQSNVAYVTGTSATISSAKGGVQVANLGLNTATLGTSTLASSGLVQAASVNVSQGNYAGAFSAGSIGASVTGLTQAATTTINSAVNGAAIIK